MLLLRDFSSPYLVCSLPQDTTALPPASTVQSQTLPCPEAKTAAITKAFNSCMLFLSSHTKRYKNPIHRRPAGQLLLKVSFWLFQKVLSGSGHSWRVQARYKSYQGKPKISASDSCTVSDSAGLSYPEHPLTSMEILDDDGEQWWCWLRQWKPWEPNV